MQLSDFQTLSLAALENYQISKTVLRARFCHPRPQELHVLILQNPKFDSKTDDPKIVSYADPITQAVLHAADAAAQLSWYDQYRARRAER